jgi:hypothetical protein
LLHRDEYESAYKQAQPLERKGKILILRYGSVRFVFQRRYNGRQQFLRMNAGTPMPDGIALDGSGKLKYRSLASKRFNLKAKQLTFR